MINKQILQSFLLTAFIILTSSCTSKSDYECTCTGTIEINNDDGTYSKQYFEPAPLFIQNVKREDAEMKCENHGYNQEVDRNANPSTPGFAEVSCHTSETK